MALANGPFPLLEFPPEIILRIAESCPDRRSLNALTRTNKYLWELLNPLLYRYGLTGHNVYGSTLLYRLCYGETPKPLERILCLAKAGRINLRAYVNETSGNMRRHILHALAHKFWTPLVCDKDDLRGAVPSRKNLQNRVRCYIEEAKISSEHLVRALIEFGAEVDAVDADGDTALHIAATSGRRAVVKVLLDAGANVNRCCSRGQTPLHHSVGNERATTLPLIEAGAELNALTLDGASPLMVALRALRTRQEVVWILLKSGADPNAHAIGTETPLHYLIRSGGHGQLDLIHMLLNHGANLNLQDGNGNTVLQAAISRKIYHIVKPLLKFNPDVNIQNNRGRTALHTAVRSVFYGYRRDMEELVLLLLKHKANTELRDHNGITALEYAEFSDEKGLVKILRKAAQRQAQSKTNDD